MAKRHTYTDRKKFDHPKRQTGTYVRAHQRMNHTPTTPSSIYNPVYPAMRNLQYLATVASNYLWIAYNSISGNYVALASVIVVVMLSFLLPDISQKLKANSDLKTMKKVLDMMSTEVNRAEVACLTVADEICCMQCSMRDDGTETTKDFKDLSICTSHCMHATHSEPVQVEKKIGFFRRIFFPHRNTSHKEIAIMSYVYTDSFDAQKTVNSTENLLDF